MSKKIAPFRMNPVARALAALATVAAPSWALAQLNFSDTPPIDSSTRSTTTTTKTTTTTTTSTTSTTTYAPGTVSSVLPNIIIGFDVTSSMNTVDATCTKGTRTYTVGGVDGVPQKTYTTSCATGVKDRMSAMRDAVIATFSNPSLIGKFRLAFQSSYWDYGFGSNRFFPNPLGYDNSMKLFDAAAQAQFVDWSANLPMLTCSTTASLIANAGEYLKGRWMASNSYFGSGASYNYMNYVPGVTFSAWNINTYNFNKNAVGSFAMTCGINNYTYNSSLRNVINPGSYLNYTGFLGGKKPSETSVAGNPWNATSALAKATKSGTVKTTPATADPNPPLTCRRSYFIFMTDGGSNGALFSMRMVDSSDSNAINYYNKTGRTLPDGNTYDPAQGYASIYKDNAIGNLSSEAFYYWSTDLTGAKSGVVDNTKTMTVGDQTYGSKFYPAYWNPQNDPATWQHMQTYAIGFGTAPSGAGQLYAAPTATPKADKTNWTVCNPNLMTIWGSPYSYTSMFTAGLCTRVGLTPGVAMPAFDSHFGNFFTGYASGTYQWPYTLGWGDDTIMTADLVSGVEAVLDLPHATYNGRGRFFPATSADALANAFSSILQEATNQSAPPSTPPPPPPPSTTTSTDESTDTSTDTSTSTTIGMASAAGSSTQLVGGMVYTAGYTYNPAQTNNNLGGWSGSLTGYAGSDLTGSTAPAAKWTATIPSSRQIFTASSSGKGTTLAGAGVVASTVTDLKKLPLGDIVNSQLVVVSKPTLQSLNEGYIKFAKAVNAFNGSAPREGMVYVGANDGMLHAFDAGQGVPGTSAQQGTGEEQFAYVPRGLLGSLSAFGPDYKHRYWVDGGIFSGDAQLDDSTYASIDYGTTPTASKNWATVLVGTLGAGGPGYFVLDVTKPTAISELDTNTLSKVVLTDTTDTTDANIGYQFGQPVMDQYNLTMQSAQIVRINTNDPTKPTEWAVIMGNGYNNASGLPVLLIQSLSKAGRPLYKVEASCTAANSDDCVKAGNGLGQPRAVDVDGNGTADIVYAGDLMGNLWKFDISNMNHSQWKVAYNQKPMFRAVGPTGKAQPITSAPVVVPNKKGGFMVGFGTGKNLTKRDTKDAPSSTPAPLNSFYALYDKQKMSIETKDVPNANPARKVNQLTLAETDLPAFCDGATRCTTYLDQRTAGGLSSSDSNLSWGATDKPVLNAGQTDAEKIASASKLGWYFDIPETDNGNAAKVLSNPMMLSDNIVLFFADNVASSTLSTPNETTETNETNDSNETTETSGPNTPSVPPAQPSDGESCGTAGAGASTTTTTTTTKTDTATTEKTTTTTTGSSIKPPLTSVNYFNLMTGAPLDNITITVNGEQYVFNNIGNPAEGSKAGNRFRRTGTMKSVRHGADGLKGLPNGTPTGSPNGSSSFDPKVANSPGRRAGWRVGR